MSIGRRFLNIARTELNSLLDFAAKYTGDEDGGGGATAEGSDGSMHGFSARELEEELERRRSARQEVEDAIHGRRTPEPPPPRRSTTSAGRRAGADGGMGTNDAVRVHKAYAALEVPAGSDFETVRKAYRVLMRKYHPDHHTESPAKQRAANEVAQRLTEAYKLLEKKLRK